MDPGQLASKNGTMTRKRRISTAIFTDAWCPGRDERKLTEEELLPGEVSAVVFQVGCYIVRSAERVHRKCIIHEMSAKHMADAGNVFVEICRILQPVSADECEYIGDIYAVKEHASVPDEAASLIVYSHYEGRASGSDTWYQFTADGRVTRSEEFPFPAEAEAPHPNRVLQDGDVVV